MNTHLPTLIAVHGPKRSGKGTIAEHLVRTYGYHQVKFAEVLKAMIRELLRAALIPEDLIERCIESDLKEVPFDALHGKSTRYAMQIIGTEWRDLIYTKMWSVITVERIRSIRANGGRCVLDDLRFPHEVELLQPEGPELWCVNRTSTIDAFPAEFEDLTSLTNVGFPVDLAGDVVERMASVLFGYCGLEAEYALANQGVCISQLGGSSVSRVLTTLRQDFKDLMMAPWTPSPVTTSTHISEKGLPPEIFDRFFVNDGSIADLHQRVNDALMQKAA